MATMFCALCKRPVEARRQIGAGTVVLAVLSAGLWLIAVPFYPKRCSICRSTAVSRTGGGDSMFAGGGDASPARIAQLEQRLSRTEAELDSANTEIDRLHTERDFYRQLLEDPAARERQRRGKE